MLLSVPNSPNYSNLAEGDLIALTKDDKFIGYAIVHIKLDSTIVLDADKKVVKAFNELIGEDIPFSFNIDI